MHLSASSSDLLASSLPFDDIDNACIITFVMTSTSCDPPHEGGHEIIFFVFLFSQFSFVEGERKEEMYNNEVLAEMSFSSPLRF
jgi:hypothetical protein